MAVSAALGDALVPLDELDSIAASSAGDDIRKVLDLAAAATTPALAREVSKDTTWRCDVDANISLQASDLQRAIKAAIPIDPYQGIGPGKPLMIVIETV